MIYATVLSWTLLGQGGGTVPALTPFEPGVEADRLAVGASLFPPAPNLAMTYDFVGPVQPTWPGSRFTIDQAVERAHTIVIGRPTRYGIVLGMGSVAFGKLDLKVLETLKGDAKRGDREQISMNWGGEEGQPEVGQDYVFFIEKFHDHDTISKVIPRSHGNVEAVKQAIWDEDDRLLPNARVSTVEAQVKSHTIVVAEVMGGGMAGAGGVGLGWCDLKVTTPLRGEAKTVDGKRIGYTAYGQARPPAVGRSYLFYIGKDHDLDTIFKIIPTSPSLVRAVGASEARRRAVPTGAACRMQGGDLTIAAAEAKSHTIMIAEVLIFAEVGAGGYAGAGCQFRVESAFKGSVLPGDRNGFGWRPILGDSSPQMGESIIVFVGKSLQDIDTVFKFLPATAGNIQAVRDQIIATGLPVTAR